MIVNWTIHFGRNTKFEENTSQSLGKYSLFFLEVTEKMLKGRNARSIHCNVLSFIFAFNCCLQPAQHPNLELSYTLLTATEAAASAPPAAGKVGGGSPFPAPFQTGRVRRILQMFRLRDKRPEGPDASREKKEEPHGRVSQKGTGAPAAPTPPHPTGPSPGGSEPPHCPRAGGGRRPRSSTASAASSAPASCRGSARKSRRRLRSLPEPWCAATAVELFSRLLIF